MRKGSLLLPAGVVVLLASAVFIGACQGKAPEPTGAATTAEPHYNTTGTIKDLMQSLVDRSADIVWMSVTTVHSEKGIVETVPRNDEEWLKVRHGAIALAEATNLLMMPGRHVAREGEKSETPGVELEPKEMEELINKDRTTWNERAKALHDAATEVLAAVDAKNSEKVFEVGEHIERACENCHTHYWYPNEKISPVQASAP